MSPAPGVDHRANNFDFVRFFAASLVLYSHCFALTGAGGGEPLVRMTGGQFALGGVAVRVFFVISGYLVMQSWLRRPRIAAFASARFLRLFPGLAVALAFCVLIGAAVTSLPAREYWTDPATLAYYWRNVTLRTEFVLPGVFEHTIEPRAVNGTLWSLNYEFHAYLVLLALGVVGAFRARWIGAIAWLAAFSLTLLWRKVWGIQTDFDWPVLHLYACFVGAALVALFPEVRRLLPWLALVALAAFPMLVGGPFADSAMDAILLGGTLWLAELRSARLSRFGRYGDFSYGVFIYAFPVQQLVAWQFDTRVPWAMLAIAFPATLALAALSWHLVEKRCLALKGRFAGPRRSAAPAGT